MLVHVSDLHEVTLTLKPKCNNDSRGPNARAVRFLAVSTSSYFVFIKISLSSLVVDEDADLASVSGFDSGTFSAMIDSNVSARLCSLDVMDRILRS